MAQCLDGTEGGVWCVRTVTATYLLDLDARTLTRYPAASAPQDWPSPAELRRDGHDVPVLAFLSPVTIGFGMNLMIDVRGDDIPTWRQSTAVVAIEAVDLPSAGR